MRPTSFVSTFALFTAVANAWPSGWEALDVVKEAAQLRSRQDDNTDDATTRTSFDLSLTATQGNTATTERTTRQTDDATSSGRSSGNNNDETSSGKSGDRTSTGKGSSDDEDTETTRTFDNRMPAGGVQMVTPDPMAGAKYYKIKDYVTFGFNFTSLSITPDRIDILATNALNSATYTIAGNYSVTKGGDEDDGATQAVTWDTGEYQSTASIPLLVGTYTLMIHDAAKDVDATPMAGYLGTWEQFTFGMYTPQPYTSLADYVCATCNGAMTSVEKQTLGFLFGMAAVTVLSFSWFVGVAGLW